MLTIKNYVRAKSIEQAYELNQSRRNRIIGGMLWLKMSRGSVNTAIDLCDLGLDQIEDRGDCFAIGAMVSLRSLELHEELNACCGGILRDAVKDIVGVQFRNSATVGGSIFGRFGFSDVLTAFLALDTCVELYRGGIVPLEEFARMKRDRDVLVRVIVRKKPGGYAYLSMRNSRTDFPVIACAVSRTDSDLRAVIGARPGRALVVRDENKLLEGGITPESAAAFAAYAAQQVPTGSNTRASAEYRTHLVRVLTERALLQIGGQEHGN